MQQLATHGLGHHHHRRIRSTANPARFGTGHDDTARIGQLGIAFELTQERSGRRIQAVTIQDDDRKGIGHGIRGTQGLEHSIGSVHDGGHDIETAQVLSKHATGHRVLGANEHPASGET